MNDNAQLQSSMVAASVESGKAMGSAEKGAGGKDAGLDELFKLNQIWYRMPPTLSLVSKRTITRCNFQQTVYTPPLVQQVASAIFNTGEFQISGCTSFLVIQAGIDKASANLAGFLTSQRQKNTVHAYLGQGGIMNIIEEVTFLSASGTEVDRQQNKGLQASHVNRNRMSQDWYNTSGEIQGYPAGSFQECYDTLGSVGASSATTVAAPNQPTGPISPWLLPSRATKTTDYSVEYLAAINAGQAGTYVKSAYDVTSNGRSNPIAGSVDVSFNSVQDSTYNPVIGQAPIFFIPLSDLLGCFNPYMKALIPAAMLAGGRLEIRFKNMTEALIATGPGFDTTSLTTSSVASVSNANTFLNEMRIYNIYFLLDSFQLNDSVLKRLGEIAADKEGLSLMFDTWDWTQTPVSGLSFEAQVSQARSRISRSFCVLRDQLIRTSPFANSLASEAAVHRIDAYSKQYTAVGNTLTPPFQPQLVSNYQAQLGSLYFPQQPLQTVEEMLMNSYYTFSRAWCNTEEISAVSLSEFMGATGSNLFLNPGNTATVTAPLAYQAVLGIPDTPNNQSRSYTQSIPAWAINWGSATYGFLAERSQLLQLTGLPISNARLLRHRFTVNYSEASGTGRLVDVFTEYTRVAKVFLGGRIVMRE
jgi:hypothetical protein